MLTIKRLIIISSILLSIITISIISIAYAKNANDIISDKINFIEANADKQADILWASINDLTEYWAKKERLLSTYVRHDEIEKVNLSLKKIKKFAVTKMYDDLKIELEQLRFFINHIFQQEIPSYENIL